MKRLIINADDFNLTAACDLAIMGAYSAGAITSASCIVWPERPVPMLVGKVPAGVHLRLTDGGPVLGAEAVPSLVTEDGQFPRSRAAIDDMVVDLGEVHREWTAQIQMFSAHARPTHLDSHRHTHSLAGIDLVYEQLCQETVCAGVPLSLTQALRLRSRSVPCAAHSELGWLDGKALTLERLLREAFRRHQTVHLMTHPGFVDDDLRKASFMVDVRRAEFDVLTSSSFASWLRTEGIERVGMSALAVPDIEDTTANPLAKIDILYCAWNRVEFTRPSIDALLANTDWARVRNLWLYDDGSTDGTMGVLESVFDRGLPPWVSVHIARPSPNQIGPVGAMNHFISNRNPLPWFAKIDNDVVLPPGWLPACLRVLGEHPSVDLLGIEAIYPPLVAGKSMYDGARGIELCSHIGGIGLMRTEAFDELPVAAGRMGFSDWQIKHEVVKAWLNPGLPVILLDRLPFAPWDRLSAAYERDGLQRPWKRYTAADAALWSWWTKGDSTC